MQPPIRYARSGELHIAYQMVGDGPPDLIWVPGSLSHLSMDWEHPGRARFLERIGSFCRLIRLDRRGQGLSDRPTDIVTLDERMDDVRAVMDAAGSERAAILGDSEGGVLACLFAATHSARTTALILWGSKARFAWSADYPWGPSPEGVAEILRELDAGEVGEWPPMASITRWTGGDPHETEYWSRYYVAATSPGAMLASRRMNLQIDIRQVLPTIGVPTLVFNRVGDAVVTVEAGRDLASRIPGAIFVELPGSAHVTHIDPEPFLERLQEFLTAAPRIARDDRFLTTLVFVDLVSSTETAAALGDARWRDLLQRHYDAARRQLDVLGGTEIDIAGDGLLASFDAPTRAIRFARAIERADRDLGLASRAGVHTGEVERVDHRLRGIAVHIAARVAGAAKADEVLVSASVRDLVAGSGLEFEDRGLHALKGTSGSRQLFSVV